MGFFSKLFGHKTATEPDPKTQAMAALMTRNDENAFLTGLQAAIALADQGDQRGLTAMRLAIVARSGKPAGRFYEPGVVGGSATQLASRYANARVSLLELARNKALLNDTHQSGEILSAALVAMQGNHSELESLAFAVNDAGGAEQALAFQLLYNEQRCATSLRARSQPLQ